MVGMVAEFARGEPFERLWDLDVALLPRAGLPGDLALIAASLAAFMRMWHARLVG